jgi:hypothetical protein
VLHSASAFSISSGVIMLVPMYKRVRHNVSGSPLAPRRTRSRTLAVKASTPFDPDLGEGLPKTQGCWLA